MDLGPAAEKCRLIQGFWTVHHTSQYSQGSVAAEKCPLIQGFWVPGTAKATNGREGPQAPPHRDEAAANPWRANLVGTWLAWLRRLPLAVGRKKNRVISSFQWPRPPIPREITGKQTGPPLRVFARLSQKRHSVSANSIIFCRKTAAIRRDRVQAPPSVLPQNPAPGPVNRVLPRPPAGIFFETRTAPARKKLGGAK